MNQESLQTQPANSWTEIDGRDYVVIENLESFDPFFLNIVSPNEQWFFCSSNGALAAGRRSSESSLFPYYTVDKITDNWNTTGAFTSVVCEGELWTPFQPLPPIGAKVRRKLMKSTSGDEVVFDEVNECFNLRMTYSWQLSDQFGLIRKAKLTNLGGKSQRFRLVDGLDNFLPPGVSNQLQNQYSCLADAYKVSELECEGSLLIHRLASGIIDAPIPLECLYATTVWSHGLGGGPTYTSRDEANRFLRGDDPEVALSCRARRGAFFLARELAVAPGESIEWMIAADINQTQGDVAKLRGLLSDPGGLVNSVEDDLQKGREKLQRIVASCDGFQATADKDSDLYHYQNTLCNILRGGVPEKGYQVSKSRFFDYLTIHNKTLSGEYIDQFERGEDILTRNEFIEQISTFDDPDLSRIANEYLPLVLSRRHGDPSRPWNQFDIRLTDENGDSIHRFEGNWRDIFQNWEALALSYPGFLGGFIAKFLNASTADGYNPYRVTSEGVDWEAPEEDNPWGAIGYWGDHQIIYLLKLLEMQQRVDPQNLGGKLNQIEYVYADVPYRIKSWKDILSNPRDTVDFDFDRHQSLHEKKESNGADGLLLCGADQKLIRSSLCEKLLLPAVVKMGNLVPGGGIWLNTQKPEWNDANNALAGYGLSVVTTGYLYRYFGFLHELLEESEESNLYLSGELIELLNQYTELFDDKRWTMGTELDGADRLEVVKAVGEALESHRNQIYEQGPSEPKAVDREMVVSFICLARKALGSTLKQNRRADNLWHAYNILNYQSGSIEIQHLDLMLEGQVSILSSGFLKSAESADLLAALQTSDLKSESHPTYLLYPDRALPSFLEANVITKTEIGEIPSLSTMVRDDDTSLVYSDAAGKYRFHPDLTNGSKLVELIEARGIADRFEIESLYEKVFQHKTFTGRSGSMFGYEGLGCVYWHMISKLMLAVQEVVHQAMDEDAPEDVVSRLVHSYYAVQKGLGYRQSPEQFGAFPAEPYSHSPAEGGAKQPGLTGQVKEGILCRFGELGVEYTKGSLRFRPRLLRFCEFTADGTLSFSISRIPVVYHCDNEIEDVHCVVHCSDNTTVECASAVLSPGLANAITKETGQVTKIEVRIPKDLLQA